MKFKSLFLTTAAAMAFAACSSDEPAKNGGNGNIDGEGATMYLTVNITDANTVGRAEEGDLVPGDPQEHVVNTAHFFFFDKDKMFVTEANVWSRGQSGDFEDHNVEFQSNNVLVLKNLTKKNLPKYLITVLNATPELLAYVRATPRTMEEVRNFTLKWNNGESFVMSTSSFNGGASAFPGQYDNAVYYANLIQESNLKTEPVDVNNVPASDVVKIYVERLAAKYTIVLPEGNPFPVDVTIAGLDNDNNNNVELGAERVYVKIENFGVTGTEEKSYLGKNLDGLTGLWNTWNIAQLHRSYWGKSVSYDDANAVLDRPTFSEVNTDLTKPVYSNETTKDFTLIRNENNVLTPAAVTNIVFTATIYADKAATTPLDLILFSGVYYKKDQFVPYILNRLNATNQLNYWIKTGSETETNPDGTLNRDNYTQVSAKNVELAKDGASTGIFKLVPNIGADTQLYAINGNTATAVETSAFETALNTFFTNEKPMAYTGGASVYYVPVEHLLGKNAGSGENYDYTVSENGQYGVVRNHWYQIEVGKVFRLGQGVFDPSDNSTEDLIPDNPSKETFGMAANISILSWKVVKQSVDL